MRCLSRLAGQHTLNTAKLQHTMRMSESMHGCASAAVESELRVKGFRV